MLLEELEDKKYVKIFVKEDLNQTVEFPTTVTSEVAKEVMIIEEPEEKANDNKVTEETHNEEEANTIEAEELSEKLSKALENQTEEDMTTWFKKKRCFGNMKRNWGKKKKWFKEKFDKKFDEAIQNALPQIAVHVAQILRNE